MAVLTPWQFSMPGLARAAALCIRLVIAGAAVLGVCHLLQIAAKAQFIAAGFQASPFPAFLHTPVFQANVVRAFLAAGLAGAGLALMMRPSSPVRWAVAAVLVLLLAVTGAWLTHGASRLDQRITLMAITAVHQFAAVAWAGGVVHIIALWRLTKHDPSVAALWPEMFARFSGLGAGALTVLLLTGVPLTVIYVESLAGLAGTGYGSMLVAKWVLMAAALGLAAANFRAARHSRRLASAGAAASPPSPFFTEVESIVLVVVLFVAAALAALPPAVDITDQRATFAEVAQTFAPKRPQLTSPTLAEEQAASAESTVIAREQASAEENWSDYNHNVSGLILFAIALVALLERTGRAPWARHWPLGFLALAAFVLLRSDPSGWPLSPDVGFLESFRKPSWIQHKIAGFIPIALGIMEWRARAADTRPWLPFVFPVLCIVGGLLLLTHSHGAFEPKAEYLTQVSHTAMGTLAVLMGCGRWLELRLATPAGRLAGLGSIVALNLIALILVFYREPLG
jgi:putative copper resistance protein D